MGNEDDFIAIVKYKTTQEGGRKTPAFSGYRPQVKFPFTEMQTGGRQTFIDKNVAYPGDTVKTSIKVISPHFFESSLKEGLEFELCEGPVIIATGVIMTIMNVALKRE